MSYRITEGLRLEGTSEGCLVQLLLRQDHPELVAQGYVQTAFEYFQ